ncbi:MAG: Gfo/Idh/MocA family oxidoreductase [Parvularculaceae bacterium]
MSVAESPKVAVIGAGHWGKNLARNFAELGALAAVCDPNPETAAREAEKNGVEVKSFEDVLQDDGVAAVAIAAPAELHADLALEAFAADKHVYVEKPLALTREEGRRMLAAADDAGRVLMVGHLLQYHPAFEAALACVRDGGVGALRYAYSHRLSLGKFRRAENALWSFAPHDVSMLLALFGEAPETVSGRGGSYVTDGVEDEYRVDMTFSGGRRAHVFASWLHPFKEHRLVIVGEKGMIVFEDSNPDAAQKLRLYRHGVAVGDHDPIPTKVDAEAIPYASHEPLKQECAHFLECAATGATPRTDGVEAMAVLDALLRAEGV